MKKEKIKVGDRVESSSCGWYTILEKNNGYCVIKFDTGYITTVDYKVAKSGNVKDPLFPQVLGIGYFGVGPYKNKMGSAHNGFNSTPEYNAWQNMLQRCYYDKYICRVDGVKTYDDVEVDPVWHNYQNFAEWYIPRRKLFDENGIKRPSLDKDILAVPNQPKVYSPNTCCLVPMEINGALIGIDKEAGGILKSINGYYLNQKGKRVTDYIESIEEVMQIRKIVKQEQLTELANKYQHVIEPKVYNKLCNWF